LGPGAGDSSWSSALKKYGNRARQWGSLHLGLNLNILAYRTFVASVLTFIMQLAVDFGELEVQFQAVLRRLAPGPGNWASVSDLCNLHLFGFRYRFVNP